MTKLTLYPANNEQAGQMTWRLPGQPQPMLHLRLSPLAQAELGSCYLGGFYVKCRSQS